MLETEGKSQGGRPPRFQLRSKGAPPLTSEQLARLPNWTYKTQSFLDHRGQTCFACYHGMAVTALKEKPLIPAWSFQVYIINGMDATLPASIAFCEGLFKKVNAFHNAEIIDLRLDFTFFPAGTTNLECMEHYLREKDSDRQKNIFAIVPTYHIDGTYGEPDSDNIVLVVDDEDIESRGLIWLDFDDTPVNDYSIDARETLNDRTNKRIEFEGSHQGGCLNMNMEGVWRYSILREQLDSEFQLAKELRQQHREDVMNQIHKEDAEAALAKKMRGL